MSIYGTSFSIEDEREWIADLEADGIRAGVIRDGEPEQEDWDAPYVYQGSNVIPEDAHLRGGSVDLAYISKFVRHHRDNPDATDDPHGVEPFLRLGVCEARRAPHREEGSAVVLLMIDQARRLAQALTEWVDAASD